MDVVGMDRTVFRKDQCNSHGSLQYFLLITELYDYIVFKITSGCHRVCELTAAVGTCPRPALGLPISIPPQAPPLS